MSELSGITVDWKPGTLSERIGFEWCRPTFYTASESGPYPGYVAIQSGKGWLIYCEVVKVLRKEGYTIERRPVRIDDLETVEAR